MAGAGIKKIGMKSTTTKIYAGMLLLYGAACAIQPHYFSLNYINMMLLMASFLGIASMGQTMVILTGGIDLSIPYILTVSSCLLVQETQAHSLARGIVSMVFVALVCGFINGVGIAYLRIPPIVMTLAMNGILGSVALLYTGGSPTGSSPAVFRTLATGTVLGVKTGVLVWGLLAVLFIILLRRTPFGRKVYAVGNSAKVSYLSGINDRRVLVLVYVISGLTAALSGALMTGYCGSAYLGMGDALQMQTVSAVVVGGTSILGGRGSYVGTIAGTITIYILTAILTVFNIAEAGRDIIYGAVILMVFVIYSKSTLKK